ncbi:hypothetical protein ACFVU2_19360 [Leifsonia sp. NPDC058194]|uniref:hypothetical protein n=1 Tax=Leifsonia sp. NPDC058194 TaxID=3346374 RepID=UPI0036DDA1CA
MPNPVLPKVQTMTATAPDHRHPLEADMPHTPPAFIPPVDASDDELEWKWGYCVAGDMVGWDLQWGEFAAAAEERRKNRR